jgi:hypothetical protein
MAYQVGLQKVVTSPNLKHIPCHILIGFGTGSSNHQAYTALFFSSRFKANMDFIESKRMLEWTNKKIIDRWGNEYVIWIFKWRSKLYA